jgi:hypothetical protein
VLEAGRQAHGLLRDLTFGGDRQVHEHPGAMCGRDRRRVRSKNGPVEYGRNRYTGSGGTNRGGAFDACISRELKKRKG